MTPKDRALDPEFFLRHQPITLYRLARARYANLSGIGAATAPGRWNLPGQEAIYTSTEIGVPLLERLVHTPKDTIPSNLALMRIQLSGDWPPRSSGRMLIFTTLAEAEDFFPEWWQGVDRIAIAVPSVIVPAWNVVLYPQAPYFWEHVSLISVEPFEFDPRLFAENTPAEAIESVPPTQ